MGIWAKGKGECKRKEKNKKSSRICCRAQLKICAPFPVPPSCAETQKVLHPLELSAKHSQLTLAQAGALL